MSVGPLRLKRTALLEKEGVALFNSASPWASSLSDLRSLYDSPHTTLVTCRTAVVTTKDIEEKQWNSRFDEDPYSHTHSFLRDLLPTIEGGRLNVARGSLNSYGYSPHTLAQYLGWIEEIWQADDGNRDSWKPFVISLAGQPTAIEGAVTYIREWTGRLTGEAELQSRLIAVEINLSCPNIKDNDRPSGYDAEAIGNYIIAVQRANATSINAPQVAVALKVPPYTYPAQFGELINALQSADGHVNHPVTFITCLNTLGGSFWLNPGRSSKELVKALPSSVSGSQTDPRHQFDGTGGLAGESLHPIALGNVYTLGKLLRSSGDPRLHNIQVLGVGGVMSGLSALRMKEVGASAVGIATALGREGVSVFERISNEIMLLLSDHSEETGTSVVT